MLSSTDCSRTAASGEQDASGATEVDPIRTGGQTLAKFLRLIVNNFKSWMISNQKD